MADSDINAEREDELFSSNDSDDEDDREEPKFQLCVGLREDCDRLAELVRDQLTVQALFDGWDLTRFHRIYMGRRDFTEQLEFTEEALITVRDLWLDAEKGIRHQASYFLVLAGLYLRQPFTRPSKPARIRLTSKHVDLVSNFIDACDENSFHDCVRLFDALFSEGALDLVAHPREFGLETNTLAYLRKDSIPRIVPIPKGPKLRDLQEISELRTSLAEYCAVKRGLKNAPNFVTLERLNGLVPQAIESDHDGDKDWKPEMEDFSEEEEDSIATRRQRLRNRAFVTAAARKESVVEVKLEKEVNSEEQPKKKRRKLGAKRPKPQRIKTFY